MPNDVQDAQFAAADGCRIAYSLRSASEGGDQRLVLIHSLAMDRRFWQGVIAAIPAEIGILAYDCRGHGQSDGRGKPFTTAQFAQDLAALLDHVAWPNAVIAGCSMGGCVAQEFAAQYSDLTTALCLLDTTAWYGPTAPKDWQDRANMALSKGLAGLTDFQVTRWFGDEFRANEMEKVQNAVAIFVANDPANYAASCIMLGQADLRPALPQLRMPTAIIVGEEDYATPIASAQALQAGISQASLTILAGARHLTPIERPTDIAKVLLDLLRSSAAAEISKS